eukprot:COSAG01_NODE_5881_length_3971_cov_6.184353_1_plen_80_part_10
MSTDAADTTATAAAAGLGVTENFSELIPNQLYFLNRAVGGNTRVNHGLAVPVDVTGSGHELISGLDKRNGRRQPVFGSAQ